MEQYQGWEFQFEEWMGGDVVQSEDGAAISAQGVTSAAPTISLVLPLVLPPLLVQLPPLGRYHPPPSDHTAAI